MELAVGPFERARSQVFRTALVEFPRLCPEKPLQKQNGLSGKNVFVCFRTEIKSAHANRLFITKFLLMICTVFNGEQNLLILVGHNSGRKSQFRYCDKNVTFVTISKL